MLWPLDEQTQRALQIHGDTESRFNLQSTILKKVSSCRGRLPSQDYCFPNTGARDRSTDRGQVS